MAHYAREGASFFAGYPRGSPRVAAASTLTRAAQLENRAHLSFSLVWLRGGGEFNDYWDGSLGGSFVSRDIYIYISMERRNMDFILSKLFDNFIGQLVERAKSFSRHKKINRFFRSRGLKTIKSGRNVSKQRDGIASPIKGLEICLHARIPDPWAVCNLVIFRNRFEPDPERTQRG